jgi:hypothetical protein
MKIVQIIKKKKKQLVCFDDGLIIKTTKRFNFDINDNYTLSYNGCFIDCNNEIVNMFSLDGKQHYNFNIINNSAYIDTMDILSSFVKTGAQVSWEMSKC